MSDKRKRLTANEVAEQIDEIGSTAPLRVESVMNDVAQLVRDNLTPRWQDAPDGDGLAYWVEGLSDRMPVILYRSDDERWLMSGSIPSDRDGEWVDVDGEELAGRRVCPIGERPEASV